MIPEYIKTFLALIRHGSKVNSYKLVWAKAIVEISSEHPDIKIITLQEIAKKIFKYYWNQTIYFNLTQGNNPNKRPEFVQIIRVRVRTAIIVLGKVVSHILSKTIIARPLTSIVDNNLII